MGRGGISAFNTTAGRDVIFVNLQSANIKAEQLQALVQNRGDAKEIADLSRTLGVTESAVKSFFRILGEKQVEPDKLLEKLADIAERHLTLLKQTEALRPDAPNIAELRKKAKDAIEQGDFASAENILKEAEESDVAAVKKLQETANQRLRSAASSRTSRGELSLTQLDYL